MSVIRVPSWEGARNAADLGGFALVDGGATAYGRVWRSAAPEWMTTVGWLAARGNGLCRVVDLRNDSEVGRGPEHPVVDEAAIGAVEVVRAPTEDPDDPDYLAECGPWLDHPRGWAPNFRLYPDKLLRVFEAVADASGPVLIHCGGGRDRTGMVTAILLVLTGATPEAIVANYEHGFRGAGRYRGDGQIFDPVSNAWIELTIERRSDAELDEALEDRRPVLLDWVASTDVAADLRAAGLDPARLDRLHRLLR